jgi:hypothetical protein
MSLSLPERNESQLLLLFFFSKDSFLYIGTHTTAIINTQLTILTVNMLFN